MGKTEAEPLPPSGHAGHASFQPGSESGVIDDPVWLKLIWASLNLRPEDMLTGIHYPFTMHQAMAVIWTHAGLRQNEIFRLSVGCVHEQTDDIVHDDVLSLQERSVIWMFRLKNIKGICQTSRQCREKVCRFVVTGTPYRTGSFDG
jgi:hypothetical protein